MKQPHTPLILSPEQYKEYAAAWDALVSSGSPEALQLAFQPAADERLTLAYFSIEQLLELVSVVGAQFIKARFLLAPDASGQPGFTVALFAADATGGQLSAYYLAQPQEGALAWPVAGSAKTTSLRLSGQMPSELTARWLAAWADAKTLLPAMFMTATQGPLHGYNFGVDDFMNPLFAAQPLAGKSLLLQFGLHTYYAAGAAMDAEPTQTFGLVICLAALGEDGGFQKDGDDPPLFNAGTPCPPGT